MTADSGVRAGSLSALALSRVLVRLHFRLLRNRLREGPRAGSARFAVLAGALVPIAYLGLFLNAFDLLGERGGIAAQASALYLLTTAVAVSSGALKAASGEAVTGTNGETEFILARPVSLSTLVLARGLSGVMTDLFGGLFLLPILAAATLSWRGEASGGLVVAAGLAAAVLVSGLVQLGVTALAQAAQIAVVWLVPSGRRRLVLASFALVAATGLAVLWMAGSLVLRVPDEAVALLDRQRAWIALLPGALVAAPFLALREGRGLEAAAGLLALGAGSGAALVSAWLVARLCTRRGWEQADPAAHGNPTTPLRSGGRGLGLWGKDWRVLIRDSPRLMAFVSLPILFVGAQILGSAGWGWLRADLTRQALVAYSLAAYAAAFGPLQHMGAERRAFWILRSVPVSIGRLLAAKAAFWAGVVAGLAALVFVALVCFGPAPLGAATLGLGILVVVGAAAMSFLAVGMGAGVADLADEQRMGVGLGTTYLFLLSAGLYNVVLLSPGQDRVRALLLYGIAAAAAWVAGVKRAGCLFDGEEARRRTLSATVGALGVVVLFLGDRAARSLAAALDATDVTWAQLPWTVLVGAGALLHRLGRERPETEGRWLRALGFALALGLLPALGVSWWAQASVASAGGVALLLAARALVEEIVVRGVLQAGLQGAVARGRQRLTALGLSALAGWAVAGGPFGARGAAGAILPALTFFLTGRLWAALLTRGLIELLGCL